MENAPWVRFLVETWICGPLVFWIPKWHKISKRQNNNFKIFMQKFKVADLCSGQVISLFEILKVIFRHVINAKY